MIYTINLKRWYFPGILAVAVLLLILSGPPERIPAMGQQQPPCLIIDPGHGGIDGGAISFAGDKESEINLAISWRLALLAGLYGEKAILTRSEDRAYTELTAYSEHDELVHRCELINAVPNGVLFSIHQNSFPTAQPHGAQVLYASGEQSKRLGTLTHHNIIQNLEPENRRVAEPAPENLYITANVRCPSVLVECGFMSNLSDLQKLKDHNYQTAFASVLFQSYLQYIHGESV